MVPLRVAGVRTDVLEVGAPSCHSFLDTTDSVRATGTVAMRRSAISAVAITDGRVAAVLSGHGVMPVVQSQIARSGTWTEDHPILSVQDTGGDSFGGRITAGRIGGAVDYAIAEFPFIDGDRALSGHLFARGRVPARTGGLRLGERVEHFATVRGRALLGTIVQIAADASPVELRLPDGSLEQYSDVVVVRPDANADAYSLPGESGSLIFDSERRAVATLLGGASDSGLAYALPLAGLEASLGGAFSSFFRKD